MANDQMTGLIDLVNSEAKRLGDFLTGLDDQTWSQDSVCQGWKVGDVVAHLSNAAATWANSITRSVAGDAGPPAGQSFLASGERGSGVIADAAIDSFQKKGTGLLEEFTTGYDRLAQVLGTLRAEDWDKPCFHRRGPMPLRDFVALRVQEVAVHGWDIRAGLDKLSEMWEEALPQLVSMVPRWLRIAFHPGLDLPTPARFRFDVDGPARVNQDVVVHGGSFEAGPSGDSQADVVFDCDTGNYILLIYGRLSVEHGLASGRLAIHGTFDRATEFTKWFEGF